MIIFYYRCIQTPALSRFKDYILTQMHSDSCPNMFQGLYSNDRCIQTHGLTRFKGLYSNTGAFRLWPNMFQGLYSNTGAFRLLP